MRAARGNEASSAFPEFGGSVRASFFCSFFCSETKGDQHERTRSGSERTGELMAKYKLEYIWLDGHEPVPNLRGKTKIEEFDVFPTLEELPMWGFDGSSTRQAE